MWSYKLESRIHNPFQNGSNILTSEDMNGYRVYLMMIYALDCIRIMYGWCLDFPLRILYERTDDHPELKPTYKHGHLTKILSQVPDTVDLKSSPPNSNAPSSRWR